MSTIGNIEESFKFQRLNSKIEYSTTEQSLIDSLKPFQGNEWDGSLTNRGVGIQNQRNILKDSIRTKLEAIQTPHCIYCGFHKDVVGTLEREHIAPRAHHKDFVFEPENLVLACHYCNGFLKKSGFNTISRPYPEYKRCKFYIVHPYFDDYRKYLDFTFGSKKLFIKPKGKSRKGRATIDLFDLDAPMHTLYRGALIMQKNQHLTDEDEKRINEAVQIEHSI